MDKIGAPLWSERFWNVFSSRLNVLSSRFNELFWLLDKRQLHDAQASYDLELLEQIGRKVGTVLRV
jgi:hypothetical protein